MLKAFTFVAFALLVTGCATAPVPNVVQESGKNSQLTHGNVQLTLKVGETTQAQVLENFGSPNITTIDGSGKEVWSYQRSAQVAQSSANRNYFTILIAGQSGSTTGFESSSRMITLVIKFDENGIVSDFSSRTSNF